MPFVQLSDVQPLISPAAYQVLAKEGAFSPVEAAAARIVSDRTGTDIPDAVGDRPGWVVTPMAWIIQKLTLPKLSNLSPDFVQTVNGDYQKAMDILAEHKTGTSASGPASVGAIDGLTDDTWGINTW